MCRLELLKSLVTTQQLLNTGGKLAIGTLLGLLVELWL